MKQDLSAITPKLDGIIRNESSSTEAYKHLNTALDRAGAGKKSPSFKSNFPSMKKGK